MKTALCQLSRAMPACLWLAVGVGLAPTSVAKAQSEAAPVMQRPLPRDTVSESELKAQKARASGLGAQLAARTHPLKQPRPSTESSLYSQSIILTDGEKHTLVPVGSILHLPANLRDRVATEPKGDFTFWPAFLKRNAAWLAGHEVPLEMARGDRESAQRVLEQAGRDTRLLVSVYRGCPISILEAAPATANRETGRSKP